MTQKPPARQGALWDPNEEYKVFRAYADGVPLVKIAKQQQRTKVAIEQRLKKLGLIDPSGNRVRMMPDIDQTLAKRKQQSCDDVAAGRDGNVSSRIPATTNHRQDPDYGLDIFYQIHGMSKRLYTNLKKMKVQDFRETLHHAPTELQEKHGFSAQLIQELLRFQHIYLVNPHPAALEKMAAIQEFKRVTTRLARRARTLGEGTDQPGGKLCYYLGKLNAELARLEQDKPETAGNTPVVTGPWSQLTAEKILGLIHILVASCAPDNQHAEVISARLGLGDELLNLQEIADMLHLNRDRVRWMQERVLNTLVYQLSLRTRSHARLLRELAGRLLAARDGEPEVVLFSFCNRFMQDGADWMIAALLYIVMGYDQNFQDAARKARTQKKRLEDRALHDFQTHQVQGPFVCKFDALLGREKETGRDPSHNLIPHLEGSRKKKGDDSLACEGSFLSRKCSLEMTYTTLDEYCFLQFLENYERVVWYQDRVAAVPYRDEGFDRRYYPSLALVTSEGHGLVLDVLRPIDMVRRLTLIKALAAQTHLAEQGLGFALCTREGFGPSELAAHKVCARKRAAVLALIDDKGTVPWLAYQRLKEENNLHEADLVSLILNEDLALSKNPFRLARLPKDLSFQSLLPQPAPRLEQAAGA